MIRYLYDLPPGTLLLCTVEDDTDENYEIKEGDISLIVRHQLDGLCTTFLCLTRGFVYTCHYGRNSPYAKMSGYEVYEP